MAVSSRGRSRDYFPPCALMVSEVPEIVITGDNDDLETTVSDGTSTPCGSRETSPCYTNRSRDSFSSPVSSAYPTLLWFAMVIVIWGTQVKRLAKQLAAVLPIGGKELYRGQEAAALFSSSVFYLLLKPTPPFKKGSPPAIKTLPLNGILFDMEQVMHVAFYAWSPIDVSTTLAALAKNCPRLETITIGFTDMGNLTPYQYQDLLWFGWDSIESGDNIETLTPDLKAFARVFENGLDNIPSLDADVLQEADEIMYPHGKNHPLHPMERHFDRPPVIRVVEVPLLNSGSPEETRNALSEGAKYREDESGEDSQEEDNRGKKNQSPLRTMTMDTNLPRIRTNLMSPPVDRFPNHVPQKSAYTDNVIRGKENYNPEPIMPDMPARASIQPSGETYHDHKLRYLRQQRQRQLFEYIRELSGEGMELAEELNKHCN